MARSDFDYLVDSVKGSLIEDAILSDELNEAAKRTLVELHFLTSPDANVMKNVMVIGNCIVADMIVKSIEEESKKGKKNETGN